MNMKNIIKILLFVLFICSLFRCDKTELNTNLNVTYDVQITNDKSVLVGDTIDVKVRVNNRFSSPLLVKSFIKSGDGKLLYKGKEFSQISINENFELQYVSIKNERVNLCLTIEDGYSSNDDVKEYCTDFEVLYGELDLQITIPADTVYLNEDMRFVMNYVNPNNAVGFIRFKKESIPEGSDFKLFNSGEQFFDIDYNLKGGLYEYKMRATKEGLYTIGYEASIEGYEKQLGTVSVYMRGREKNACRLKDIIIREREKFVGDTTDVLVRYDNPENLKEAFFSYDGVGQILIDGVELDKNVTVDIANKKMKYVFVESGTVRTEIEVSGIKNVTPHKIIAKAIPHAFVEKAKVTLIQSGSIKKLVIELIEIGNSGTEKYVDLFVSGENHTYELNGNNVYQVQVGDAVKKGDSFDIYLIDGESNKGKKYTGTVE